MRAADEQIIDVNDSWLNMMGYSREEVLGQPAEQFNIWSDPADRAQMERVWQEQGALRDYEVAIRHKSGEVRYISTSTETIEIEGEPCVLSIHQDITERKQMEERVHAAERLGALGRVAAGVAHEFNNILAGIMGRLDLLALEVREPGPTATLHIIQQAVEDGATVVQRVQAFSRLRTLDAPVPVAVSELVNDVVSMTQPRWHTLPEQQGHALTLRTQIEQGLVIQGNPTELREVLTNLIFNAIDASPQGGQITIGAEAHQGRVVITLQDTGTGMDALTQERIFEPFFTTKISGTGLGLAVVKDIVRSHGGQITVQSMVGQGSVFTITLPVAPPAPAPAPAPAMLPGASAEMQPALILAVDDDPGLGDMLRAMLAVGGHEVLVAASGPEALALLDQHSFDLVCTDLGMPGMNGWEVARQVRIVLPVSPSPSSPAGGCISTRLNWPPIRWTSFYPNPTGWPRCRSWWPRRWPAGGSSPDRLSEILC